MRETLLQTPRSVKKDGKEVLQVPEQRFPCSPWCRPWWDRLCPCNPRRSTVEQRSTCSLGRTPRQSRWMPEGGCDPMGSLCWSRLLAGLMTLWREEPILEQICWQDL